MENENPVFIKHSKSMLTGIISNPVFLCWKQWLLDYSNDGINKMITDQWHLENWSWVGNWSRIKKKRGDFPTSWLIFTEYYKWFGPEEFEGNMTLSSCVNWNYKMGMAQL